MSVDSALEAFATYCDSHPLDRRPTIWAHFTDIWEEPQGEIGIPGVEVARMSHSVFALLAPWALIPTMASVWLVVDYLEDMKVVNLKANICGVFNPSWSVPYTLTDTGSLDFGVAVNDNPPTEVGSALTGIKRVRKAQTLWKAEHTFHTVLPVVEELLSR